MSEKKVAIISKDAKMCRLLRNEILLMNMTVDSFSQSLPEHSASEYYAVIYDGTSPDSLVNVQATLKILLVRGDISPSDVTASVTHTLRVPFLVSQFRKIMLEGTHQKSGNTEKINSENCFLGNKKSLTVTVNGTKIKLSDHEFKILEALCDACGTPVSRGELTKLLGADSGNIVDVYICHLRKKLEDPSGARIIHTVRTKGYMTNYKLKT